MVIDGNIVRGAAFVRRDQPLGYGSGVGTWEKGLVAAVDTVYLKLHQDIVQGTYPPGARLGEVELAEVLGVSRTPIREALRRLAADGLIETVPNRGARVRTWDGSDAKNLFGVRAVLEGYAAARAAERVSPERLQTLSKLCDEMDAAARPGEHQNIETVAELNDQFHFALHDASDNPLAARLIRGLIQVPVVLRTFRSYSPNRLAQSMAQHRDIVAALEHGDSTWAHSAMTAHVLGAGSFYKDDKIPGD